MFKSKVDHNRRTPEPENQNTPQIEITSPILSGKKKFKGRAKRRILRPNVVKENNASIFEEQVNKSVKILNSTVTCMVEESSVTKSDTNENSHIVVSNNKDSWY